MDVPAASKGKNLGQQLSLRQQLRQPQQMAAKVKAVGPSGPVATAEPGLSPPRDGFDPAECLFDTLSGLR